MTEVTETAEMSSGRSVPQRLAALRARMAMLGADACIIPTGDPHMSEYVCDHYKFREYISGFTGSAGTAVITGSSAGLWTDSRYWLQAEEELAESGFVLYREGSPDVISINDFLLSNLKEGQTVCLDGSLVSAQWADALRDALQGRGIALETGTDPAEHVWEDRPALHFNVVRDHPLQYAGLSREDKLRQCREDIRRADADALIEPCLDNIAWLLNLRGSDIPCCPVFMSFLIVLPEETRLYADSSSFGESLTASLAEAGVRLLPYERFYEDVRTVCGLRVLLDRSRCSDRIARLLPGSSSVVDRPSPVMLRKCVKNSVEAEGIRAAHLRDGVAMCRFLCWLKNVVRGGDPVTELSAAEKLHALRAEQALFMDDSFAPIVGYGPHGAIVHYSATEKTDAALAPRGLVLIDSGGQYLDGTTDITRTVVLGPLTDDEKMLFTAVLRGHIALADAVFPRGVSGVQLDCLAHMPLWQMGLDYGHGTGHGVGCYLNVHEDPVRIHWNAGARGMDVPAFAEGMLTSDEPGFYSEGRFGIRHENLLLCVAAQGADSKDFLKFDSLTLVPFDLDGIIAEELTEPERNWLNSYHRRVRESVSPYLSGEEAEWLNKATRPL